jgi:hypothetical protein
MRAPPSLPHAIRQLYVLIPSRVAHQAVSEPGGAREAKGLEPPRKSLVHDQKVSLAISLTARGGW